jgi:NADPH:quinone reductase-like Zn-dependent oxidoreductase
MKRTTQLAVILPILILLTLPSWSFGRRGDRSEDSQESGSHRSRWKAPDGEERRVNPVPQDKASLEQGAKLIEHGRIKVSVSDVLPLERAAEAHAMIEDGHVQGKIVLAID